MTFLMIVGTVLTVTGVACGVAAAYGTHRRFRGTPLWPRLSAFLRRGWLIIRAVVLRRPPQVVTGTLTTTLPGLTVTARGRVTGPDIPDDADLDQQVALLIRRVTRLEEEVDSDIRHVEEEFRSIRANAEKLNARLGSETASIRAVIEQMVLDSIPLQMVGLFLVVSGTVLLSISSLGGT